MITIVNKRLSQFFKNRYGAHNVRLQSDVDQSFPEAKIKEEMIIEPEVEVQEEPVKAKVIVLDEPIVKADKKDKKKSKK